MAQELTESQIAGGVIGALIGNAKGLTAALAVAPLLGPFAPLALLLLPVGTLYGAKMGSKGLERAALMAAGCVVGEIIGDVLPANSQSTPPT